MWKRYSCRHFLFLLESHSINHDNYLSVLFSFVFQEAQVCVNETLEAHARTNKQCKQNDEVIKMHLLRSWKGLQFLFESLYLWFVSIKMLACMSWLFMLQMNSSEKDSLCTFYHKLCRWNLSLSSAEESKILLRTPGEADWSAHNSSSSGGSGEPSAFTQQRPHSLCDLPGKQRALSKLVWAVLIKRPSPEPGLKKGRVHEANLGNIIFTSLCERQTLLRWHSDSENDWTSSLWYARRGSAVVVADIRRSARCLSLVCLFRKKYKKKKITSKSNIFTLWNKQKMMLISNTMLWSFSPLVLLFFYSTFRLSEE